MPKENQKTAGLPFPPSLLMGIFLVVALLFGWKLPIPIPCPWWMKAIGYVLTLCSLGIYLSAGQAMKKAHTSSDPSTPTSAIVTEGPYRFSRNPIYLSFVLIVISLPLILGYYWGAILAPVAIDAYNRLMIEREEIYLEQQFKPTYPEYKSRVRRWL